MSDERNERSLKARVSRRSFAAGFSRVALMSALTLAAGFSDAASANGNGTAAAKGIYGQQVGKASWYGPGFHGKRTASGQTFDQHRLTAAHPRLPFGSRARVTNLYNGKSVEVTINDRGPHGGGRIIDLSRAAAKKLDMEEDGTTEVKIETKPQSKTDSDDLSNSTK